MAKDQEKKGEKAADKLELVQTAEPIGKQDKKDKKSNKKNAKKKEKKKHGNIFKEMISELKKVTWPTRKELTSYCICVFVFVAIMAVVVWAMDMGSAELIRLLTNSDSGLPSLF